jgi:3-keto-5-aminohexanoate cleavage enzyme
MTGTVITVAPTGASTSPARPLDELVATARECEALGAAVIRVHDPEALPALREATGLIVQLVSGALEARPDMAVCPVEADRQARLRELGIVPEYEITDPAQIAALGRLLDDDRPVHVGLVLGAPGGMPATAAAVVACEQAIRDRLPAGTTFSATGLGAGSLPVILAALSTGGHLRVGREDTIMYGPGRPIDSDMQLVARAVGFAQLAQRPPLTAREARELLGVPANDHR